MKVRKQIDARGKNSKVAGKGLTSFADDALMRLPQFADNQAAFTHYAKHVKGVIFKDGQATLSPRGIDMPMFSSQRQYVSAAQNFFTSSGDNILTKSRPNGDVLRFDTRTNFFGVQSQNGTIRTFFRPEDGIQYFRGQ